MIEIATALSKEQIIEQEEIFLAAVKSSNIDQLDELLHPDLLFLGSEGSLITKSVDLGAHRSGEMNIEKLEAFTEEVSIIDNTAIVVILYKTRGHMLGRSIDGDYRYIRVWKQFPEGLRVIGGSCLKL